MEKDVFFSLHRRDTLLVLDSLFPNGLMLKDWSQCSWWINSGSAISVFDFQFICKRN